MNRNVTMDNAMRRVRKVTVRRELLPSLTRLIMPAARLATIISSNTAIMGLTKGMQVYTRQDKNSLPEPGCLSP